MKFLCDVMLGKLCRWLRMIGCDCEYVREAVSREKLRDTAAEQQRVLLTRDSKIKGLGIYHVTAVGNLEQLKEVVSAFRLEPGFPGGSRCSKCNGTLAAAGDKKKCSNCGQLYWKGSHWKKIEDSLKKV